MKNNNAIKIYLAPQEKCRISNVWSREFNWDGPARFIAGYRPPISLAYVGSATLQGLVVWEVSFIAQTGLQIDLRSAQGKLILH